MDLWIRAVLSGVVLGVAVFIILYRPSDRRARDWAFAVIGLILGYWLRPAP